MRKFKRVPGGQEGHVGLSCTGKQKKTWLQAASDMGLSLSAWVALVLDRATIPTEGLPPKVGEDTPWE